MRRAKKNLCGAHSICLTAAKENAVTSAAKKKSTTVTTGLDSKKS